jgi:redox-sensitive bicupin YhaK (pirin superfamily)
MDNHHHTKRTSTVVQLPEQHQGFRNVSLMQELGNIDPFIVLTEFWMPKAFFPPHPHAGFSVMTYMFTDSEGAFINRDSQGDRSRIEAGAIHLTQAGKGILHEEIPEIEGQMCHGLQMWLNHSPEDRFAEPKAMHVDSGSVPVVQPNEQTLVRVLLGTFQGVDAAIKPLPQVDLFDVHLKPNGVFTHRVPAGNIAFVMMISGKARSGETQLEHATCVKFSDDGDSVEISTADESASFLLGTGKPFNQPNLFGGPFVMSSNEQMHQTKLRYGRGEMGQLEPSPVFNQHH